MRKLILMTGFLLLFPLAAFAQDAPKVEVFGGYSYLRADDDLSLDRNLHGWNASVAGNVNKWFGVKADFSGHYGGLDFPRGVHADLSTHLFLVGGQFTYRESEAVTPFAHVMVGAARNGSTVNGPQAAKLYDTSFALVVGGGIDVKLNKALAWRALQADYVLTTFNDFNVDRQHNLRLSTGLVLRLGDQ